MQTVVITGGTGLIGKTLTRQLADKGYHVIILTRSVRDKKGSGQIRYAAWDIEKQTIDEKVLQDADFIIHLAGAGVVEKKWTPEYKKEIVDSRTLSSKLITDTLKKHPHKVKAIISASATGWYGADVQAHQYFTETDKHATDFLGETCFLWEQSVNTAEAMNIRVCKIRTGIVLSNEGGALTEFKKPIQMGVAAILSSGKQMISWIHIDDLCRLYIYAMENTSLSGSYNAVAPTPVTNKTLMLTLAKALRGKFFIPLHVPAFVLKIMLGARSTEVLKSVTVSCDKIKKAGFTFLYPSIESAINALNTIRS